MPTILINPKEMVEPKRAGYSQGAIGTGRTLFCAGQVGIDKEGNPVSEDLVVQFDKAMSNVIRVVEEAGGKPENIVKFTFFVTDKSEYRKRSKEIGVAYRKHMGRHFPAMTVIEIKGLWEDELKVEIDSVAIVP